MMNDVLMGLSLGFALLSLALSSAVLTMNRHSETQQHALLKEARDYCNDLLAEWQWKKGEVAGNAEEYERLAAFIERIERELK